MAEQAKTLNELMGRYQVGQFDVRQATAADVRGQERRVLGRPRAVRA